MINDIPVVGLGEPGDAGASGGRKLGSDVARSRERSLVHALIGEHQAAVAVDLGAGDAGWVAFLRGRYPKATLLVVDTSVTPFDRRAGAHATGLPEGEADLVLCLRALRSADTSALLAEVHRIARPGALAVLEFAHLNLLARAERFFPAASRLRRKPRAGAIYGAAEIRDVLTRAGFDVERVVTISPNLPLRSRLRGANVAMAAAARLTQPVLAPSIYVRARIRKVPGSNAPLVSVIVPTCNSEAYLERCLLSVRRQSYRNIEVIVADNYSTDGTAGIAARFADRTIVCGPERCAQFNMAAAQARGSLLYRVDSDFLLDDTIVERAVAEVAAGADMVCIGNHSSAANGFWAAVQRFERDMYLDDPMHVAARFFKREFFEAVGGFDESLISCEDIDLHARMLGAGARTALLSFGEEHLGEPRSLGEFARKNYYYGSSLPRFVRKSGARGIVRLSPLRGTFFRHWLRFVRHPRLAAGFGVMQAVKYGAGALGFIRSVVREGRSS